MSLGALLLEGRTLDIALATGAVLAVAGMLTHSQLPKIRMTAEEQVKDRRLTETQAIRRIRLCTVGAHVLTVSGTVVLLTLLASYLWA